MRWPDVAAVRQHQDAYPLNETGAGTWDGLRWEHGACWLCRSPMLCSPGLYPRIVRLRERDGAVELQLGWCQWERLDSMPWAEQSEWEPVDQRGRPVPTWRSGREGEE